MNFLIYSTAYKTDLSGNEGVQRRILRFIFFTKKGERFGKVFADNKVLTVFELLMVEIVRKMFQKLRFE